MRVVVLRTEGRRRLTSTRFDHADVLARAPGDSGGALRLGRLGKPRSSKRARNSGSLVLSHFPRTLVSDHDPHSHAAAKGPGAAIGRAVLE